MNLSNKLREHLETKILKELCIQEVSKKVRKEKVDIKEGVREGDWWHPSNQGYPLPSKNRMGRSQQPTINPVLSVRSQ